MNIGVGVFVPVQDFVRKELNTNLEYGTGSGNVPYVCIFLNLTLLVPVPVPVLENFPSLRSNHSFVLWASSLPVPVSGPVKLP